MYKIGFFSLLKSDNDRLEVLFALIKDFRSIGEMYGLYTEMETDNVTGQFRKHLNGSTSDD